MSERNSDPPFKSTEQTQSDANIPRRRVSAGSETDLWNLDDELPSVKEARVTEAADPADESIVRIEKDKINRGKGANKTAKPKLANEVTPKAPRKPRIEPEEEAPAPVTAPKAVPKGVGMLEEEIWADFDFEEETTPIVAPAPEAPSVEEEPAAVLKPVTYRSTPLELPEPEIIYTAPASEFNESLAAIEPEPIAAKVVETAETKADSLAVDEPATPAPSIQITKFSRLEVIASLAFLALLIGSAFFGVHLFNSNVQAQVDPFATPDYPVNGAIAHVEEASTYWRAPIRTGPGADITKRDVTLIPVIDITLNEKKSESGVLRVMFYNEKGEITGDIITREFKNHRFVQNGAPTLSFASTSGFSDFGEQEAYRASLNNPWTIKVYEGPYADAPSSSFLLLFSTPISTKRQ